MLLESTALKFKLLLLLLLLLILLLMLMTKVKMPMAKAAKSTALPPLMMDVDAAFLQGTAEGALWYMKGSSLLVFLSYTPVGSVMSSICGLA